MDVCAMHALRLSDWNFWDNGAAITIVPAWAETMVRGVGFQHSKSDFLLSFVLFINGALSPCV